MNHTRRITTFLALTFLLFNFVGCGGGNEVAGPAALGTVTLDGKPLTEGIVNFYPTGDGSSALARIESDGTFNVVTSASSTGIAPGEYKVAVESWEVKPGDEDEEGNVNEEGVSRIPDKYTDESTSGLTVTITEAGPNEVKLELKSE